MASPPHPNRHRRTTSDTPPTFYGFNTDDLQIPPGPAPAPADQPPQPIVPPAGVVEDVDQHPPPQPPHRITDYTLYFPMAFHPPTAIHVTTTFPSTSTVQNHSIALFPQSPADAAMATPLPPPCRTHFTLLPAANPNQLPHAIVVTRVYNFTHEYFILPLRYYYPPPPPPPHQ